MNIAEIDDDDFNVEEEEFRSLNLKELLDKLNNCSVRTLIKRR